MPLCAAAHLHESHGVPGFGQELEIRHLAVLVDAAEAVAIEPEDHRTLRGGRLCGLRGRGRVRALLRLVVAEDAAHLTVVLERQHQREIQIQRLPAEILHMGIDDVIQQEDRRTINAGVNGSTHGWILLEQLISVFIMRHFRPPAQWQKRPKNLLLPGRIHKDSAF